LQRKRENRHLMLINPIPGSGPGLGKYVKTSEDYRKMNIEVSVIIPAHHEGRLAHSSMLSVFRSADYADKRDVKTEIIVIMDTPDETTREYFSRYENSEILLETVDFSDVGLTRNFGINISSGRYITLLDADNLFGQNWIYESFRYLGQSEKDVIVHPEYHIVFGTEDMIFQQLSSDDPECNIGNLIENNYWDTVCTVKREILLKYPYQTTMKTRGFGFEDWHFNCVTLADGIEHRPVPGTVHFLRKKRSGSQLAHTIETNRVVRPNKLFDPDILASMTKQGSSGVQK